MDIKKAIEESNINAINRIIRLGYNDYSFIIGYCIRHNKSHLLEEFLNIYRDNITNKLLLPHIEYLINYTDNATFIKILKKYHIGFIYINPNYIKKLSLSIFDILIDDIIMCYDSQHTCYNNRIFRILSALNLINRYDLLKCLMGHYDINIFDKITPSKYMTSCILIDHLDFTDDIVLEIGDFIFDI